METGADCRILYGFGEKICQMIDEKLPRTISTGDLEQRRIPTNIVASNDEEKDDHPDVNPPAAKQTKRMGQTKKTISAEPALFNNPTTTISTLLGITTSPPNSSRTRSPPVQILPAGSFQILLCIDNAEASRSTQKVLLENLKKSSIDYDVRKLNIGDFLWIVRCKFDFYRTNIDLDLHRSLH